MRRDYGVVKVDWFLRNEYSISYPLLICHALWKKTKNLGLAADLLNKLKQGIQHNDYFYERGFLETIPFKNKDGTVVVDRTQGCYPLVLYPEDNKPEHGDRKKAFLKSINDIQKNLNNVIQELQNHTSWTEDTQKALDKILSFGKSNKPKL